MLNTKLLNLFLTLTVPALTWASDDTLRDYELPARIACMQKLSQINIAQDLINSRLGRVRMPLGVSQVEYLMNSPSASAPALPLYRGLLTGRDEIGGMGDSVIVVHSAHKNGVSSLLASVSAKKSVRLQVTFQKSRPSVSADRVSAMVLANLKTQLSAELADFPEVFAKDAPHKRFMQRLFTGLQPRHTWAEIFRTQDLNDFLQRVAVRVWEDGIGPLVLVTDETQNIIDREPGTRSDIVILNAILHARPATRLVGYSTQNLPFTNAKAPVAEFLNKNLHTENDLVHFVEMPAPTSSMLKSYLKKIFGGLNINFSSRFIEEFRKYLDGDLVALRHILGTTQWFADGFPHSFNSFAEFMSARTAQIKAIERARFAKASYPFITTKLGSILLEDNNQWAQFQENIANGFAQIRAQAEADSETLNPTPHFIAIDADSLLNDHNAYELTLGAIAGELIDFFKRNGIEDARLAELERIRAFYLHEFPAPEGYTDDELFVKAYDLWLSHTGHPLALTIFFRDQNGSFFSYEAFDAVRDLADLWSAVRHHHPYVDLGMFVVSDDVTPRLDFDRDIPDGYHIGTRRFDFVIRY